MRELDRKDLYWVLRILPREVSKLMKRSEGRLVLAGGFVRCAVSGEAPSDIDLFSPSKDLAKTWAQELALANRGKLTETDNAITVRCDASKLPVQFIHRWTYDHPEGIVKDFDFTIACAAVWGLHGLVDNWHSLCDDAFYSDLAAKRLVYRAPKRAEDAGGSMLRVLKFYQKGYRIPLDSLGAVIARLCSGIDERRLGSVGDPRDEATVARVLTGLLREVDPLLDPEHVAHLPSSDEVEIETTEENQKGA